ncbi:MAG: putative cation/proton antiporter YbaL [Fimbriimonadaceae bacterium]|nr:putative cation/proton antiporter YbaL [Fimbriimonadaceae bacterium]
MAFLFGLLAVKLRLPIIVGYLAAGIAIGPFTPGFVADQGIASQLAEIGVSLLMFGVGLHFSVRDLLAVRRIALPGAIGQVIVATLLGAVLGRFWGWDWIASLVFGLSLSVASTVVLLRGLDERNQLDTADGRIAVGWLIVEDIVTVVALVALPALAISGTSNIQIGGLLSSLFWTLLQVGVFVAFMLIVGQKVIPLLLGRVARTGLRELFTLGVLALALVIAFGSATLFGVSPALGAFFAGIVIGQSKLSHRASAETLPLQEIFSVLFFVAVGMLFNPRILLDEPLRVLAALVTIMVGKSLAAAIIVLAFRYPVGTALMVSASLAQVGEFSYILINLGIHLKLVPFDALNVIVAASILSIGLNPIVFRTIDPIDRWLRKRPRLLALLERPSIEPGLQVPDKAEPGLSDHAVIVGYGRVGEAVGRALSMVGERFAVIELDADRIEALTAAGIPAVFGDASRSLILAQAGTANARMVIVATPDTSDTLEIAREARELNPEIRVLARTHQYDDIELFHDEGIDRVVMGEQELALQLGRYALAALNFPAAKIDQIIEELRQE